MTPELLAAISTFISTVGLPTGLVIAGVLAIYKAAGFFAPRFDRLVDATETTAKSTSDHSVTLTRIEVNDGQIVELVREALATANNTKDLCEQILEAVKK